MQQLCCSSTLAVVAGVVVHAFAHLSPKSHAHHALAPTNAITAESQAAQSIIGMHVNACGSSRLSVLRKQLREQH